MKQNDHLGHFTRVMRFGERGRDHEKTGIVWGPPIHESGVPDPYRNSYIKENGQFC
jgi:hypothetical protein